jgi:hypothetical protein
MADPLATPEQIEPYWRPLTAAETVVATALIAVASSIIRRRIPDIDTRIADATVDVEVVYYVIAEMIKSAVEAPSRPVDAKGMSETAGPFSRSFTFATAASRIALTDDLIDLLGATVTAQIGSMQIGPPRVPRFPDYRHKWACWR